MGFLDSLLKKKPKEQPVEHPTQLKSEPPEEHFQAPQSTQGGLNLSKKIGLNLTKMNLDDADVRKKRRFLLDVSGSMNDEIHDVRKIDSLRDVMDKYPDAQKICFSNGVSECQDIPEPGGGTDLARALRFIKSKISPLPERIVVISDGEPDSRSDAKAEAAKLGLPIDIIFIGDEESSGEWFMEELAQQTGGEHFVV